MNFDILIGQTFEENEFYELLLFELEENFEKHFFKFIHLYFDRTELHKIKITEVVHFSDTVEIHKKSRSIIEKKEWFEIAKNHCHLNLLLCRFDRTGFVSSIRKDSTRTQDWCHGWADEGPDLGPITTEEIRLGFQELMGVFQEKSQLQKLGSKKAV